MDGARNRLAVPTGRRLLLGAYVAICLLAITWPGYPLFGASIEPFVLGLPWSLAWVILWVVLTFVVLAAYEWTRPERDR